MLPYGIGAEAVVQSTAAVSIIEFGALEFDSNFEFRIFFAPPHPIANSPATESGHASPRAATCWQLPLPCVSVFRPRWPSASGEARVSKGWRRRLLNRLLAHPLTRDLHIDSPE